ncbi:uncharacterized protein C8Q71DRAFT_784821 [Rhodofomes roseus]|uniref:NADP-dependent 3-hydroxy acid dehydrogenase YdfG n=1 Tax=Rhodofomes roseus TaxID=34475 RepID=A0ABQ8K3C1_9APHY|nr:uncharacterized protein C8Q71DRAFT_784821 [Rhodofomes roseus]KAH9830850.1 hypothetical protein C8Q71DRAFT_784821 [Rhodofomes roseus]
MTGKIWFITGSSTGFGRLVTETALGHGDKVAATLRKPEMLSGLSSKYSSSQLLVLKLDVTKSDEVKQAFSAAHAHFGRIDVVFNNAGSIVLGSVEGTPDVMARNLFELNLWGAVNVTSTAVHYFREFNKPAGGHLIQNSSLCGISGFPRTGFYCGTKHAMEGITEALAAEVDPSWNIKVTLLEPGSFYTGGHGRGDLAPPHPAYKQPDMSKMLSGEGMSDPVKGVEIIYRLASLPNPPLHLPLGPDAVATFNDKAKRLLEATEAYASWSEGLELEPKL